MVAVSQVQQYQVHCELSLPGFNDHLESQVKVYSRRYGLYPEVVPGDTVYGTRDNRRYFEQHDIRFFRQASGPLKDGDRSEPGRDEQLQVQQREESLQRIPTEGKFGQGKNGCRLNYIRSKCADTSSAWIYSIFLVMELADPDEDHSCPL